MGGSRPLRALFILSLGRYPRVEIIPGMRRTSAASRTGQRPVPPLAGFWVFGGTAGPAVHAPYDATARTSSATSLETIISITASARDHTSSLVKGTIGCGTVTTSYEGMPRFLHCTRAAAINSVVEMLAVGMPFSSK